jgi:hypothetical protein
VVRPTGRTQAAKDGREAVHPGALGA